MEPCVSWIYLTYCMEYVTDHLHYEIGIFQKATHRARILLPDNMQCEGSCSVQTKVTASLTSLQRPGHWAHNCKIWGSREKSRESSTRKEIPVRGAGKEITAKFVGVDKIAYKMVTKAAECRQIKFFFLEIVQSNPPLFSYTVSNGIKPLWDETANPELIIFFT